MGSQRPLSRRQAKTRGSRKSRTTRQNGPQPAKSGHRRFLFVVAFFLVLILAWALAQAPPDMLFLWGIVAFSLVMGVLGIWLFVRNRRKTAGKGQGRAASRPVSIADILRLSPSEFEDFVGDLLEVAGRCRNVQRIGGANDQGVDLLAKDRFGRPFVVQCKRYQPSRKVVAKEIRDFQGGRLYYRANEGLFVTTSTFTSGARETLAHFYQHTFSLDGEGLVELVQQYWEALPSRWQQRLRG